MKNLSLAHFRFHLIFFLLCLANAPQVLAQLLDPSFGNNGKVITTLNEAGNDDFAKVSVLQPDGKTVVAGFAAQSTSSNTSDAIAVRFNEDGTPDLFFGINGIARIDATYSNDLIYDMALQPDGKLVLAGASEHGFLIIRLMSDGSLDSSFASDGIFEYNYSLNYYEELQSVGILADGKILAAGYTTANDNSKVLVRMQQNGTIDSSFGTNGFKEEGTVIAAKLDMVIDDLDNILICGSNANSSVFGFMVERFDSEGIPDSSFGINGLATIDLDTTTSIANTVMLQPDGKILLAGSSNGPPNLFSGKRVALCRLMTDGSPDVSFGAGGKVITGFEHFEATALSIALSSTGKIIVGGSWRDVFDEDGGFFMLRYKQDGSIDSVFGSGGFSETKTVSQWVGITSLLITPSDKILFSASAINGISWFDFLISKFNENGKQDTSFGTNGTTFMDLSAHLSQQEANDIALLPDGSMVMTGITAADFFHGDFLIGKYNSAGIPDSSFGNSGFTRIALDNLYYYQAASVAVNGDGSIVTGGTGYPSSNSDDQAVIMKFLSNGKLNIEFGDHGMVKTKFGFYNAYLNKIAVEPDGKIAGCGTVWFSDDSSASLLFRLNADGTFDSTFSYDGILVYDLEQNTAFEQLNDLSIQNDGSILATGIIGFAVGLDTSMVIKVHADGSFDTSFGNTGIITFSIGLYSYASNILVQPDGNIVVAGGAPGNNSEDYLVYRFLPDGNADNSFGTNGRSLINHDDCIDEVHDIGLLSDGRIVLTGFQQSLVTNNPDFPLLILLPNGVPDSSFDNDGWTSLDLQGQADESFAITVQPDDKVVLAGVSWDADGWDIGLARFLTPASTGINEVEISAESSLMVYPNPAAETIHIENPFKKDKNNFTLNNMDPIVAVKNIYGITLWSGTFSSEKNVFDLDLKNIPAGIYTIELRSNEESFVGKVIRN